jgi:Contractile injection system tube protein
MTSFPNSPRLLKGAIIGVDLFNPVASVIIFQYNPDTLTRTINAQTTGSDNANQGEALRFSGPPRESIKLDVEIDAADQLEQAKFPATSMGIYPTLASLEMLLYPKSAVAIANEVLARFGIIEVIPPEAPLTLFIWGARRVLPVRLTQFTITEEAFDPNLNPIRAKLSLDLRVLNYEDLGLLSVGGSLFMVHQVAKEVMATINGVGNLPSASASFSFSANLSIGG